VAAFATSLIANDADRMVPRARGRASTLAGLLLLLSRP
jgi:hypothetical protein